MKGSSFVAGFTIGGLLSILVTLLDFFEKLKPYGIDVPGFVKKHPYISISVVGVVILVVCAVSVIMKQQEKDRVKKELVDKEEKRKELEQANEEKITEEYELLAKKFNETYPDNVNCYPSSLSRLYSDIFLRPKPAIHESKRIMIELDRRGLAKLETDNLGNYILKKIKK